MTSIDCGRQDNMVQVQMHLFLCDDDYVKYSFSLLANMALAFAFVFQRDLRRPCQLLNGTV